MTGVTAQFCGGPNDGETWCVPALREVWRVAIVQTLTLDDDPDPSLIPRTGTYKLRLAEDGFPSRADDGDVRYDWQGIDR